MHADAATCGDENVAVVERIVEFWPKSIYPGYGLSLSPGVSMLRERFVGEMRAETQMGAADV